MYRLLLIAVFSIFNTSILFSQAFTGKIGYQKTQQTVAIISLPYSVNTVERSLTEYMAKKGARSSSLKNFIVFRSIGLTSNDTTLSDGYFLAERNSRAGKDMTTLSLLPTGKNQDILGRSPGDSSRLDQARNFLDSLAPYIGAYDIQLRIGSQQTVLEKSQKKMNDLKNDQADYEKRIRKLQADLNQNKADQVKAAADLQVSINADDDTKKKLQKRLRNLIDDQGSLEKKLRKSQAGLDENKTDQQRQQLDIDNQQQILQGVKDRQGR